MEHRGWKQHELAKRAGVSQSGVGYLLRYKDRGDRHPTTSTIDSIAHAFGVQPWLLWIPDVPIEVLSLRPSDQSALASTVVTGTTARGGASQPLGLDRRILKESVSLLNRSITAHDSWLAPDEYAGFLIELYELFVDDAEAVPGKVVDIGSYIARKARQGGTGDGSTSENRRHRKTP